MSASPVFTAPRAATNDASTGDQGNPTLSREKRRIRELEEEVEQLRSNKEARRSNTTSIVNKGRAFRRVVALFNSPTDLVREYDRRAAIAEDGLDDEGDPNGPFPHSPVQDRLYRAFQEFLEFFPWIKSKLTSCESDELEGIFKELRKGADGARGDDAAGLKKEVVDWLRNLYGPIDPSISPALKSDRGLEHDVTGGLLCPAEYDWDDPEVRKNVRERHPEFLVTEDSWPKFLYDTGHAYDPDNIEKGLFRSTLLLKTFKLIFTAPSSALEVSAGERAETRNAYRERRTCPSTDKSTRSHVASLIGMDTVKPRAIAYAAVQLRFALSSLTCWRVIDNDFDAHGFYHNIVDYFEAPPGPVAKARVQELLLWWDRKALGHRREIPRAPERVAASSVARLAAQRAVAEARRAPAGSQAGTHPSRSAI
ncbi:hypothetical protein HD554DRAFT_2175775 [Boletus coccyginus]|nr:hypothetical protein HD554DRAFT_2165350 [Boletus coccyginus]KAI9449217.1 hypothetical protein HD554DRAFT_2291259 [Boletus coccyginus]KAI9453171.1 hypothetical protein HD554DRAFT_2154693 [Boletus coccyginus]KAI9462686.1 hypothetical protein HD554DRAFT_2175775 [Boletus coccyginus]